LKNDFQENRRHLIMPETTFKATGLKLFILAILLFTLLTASQAAAAPTYTLVFGAGYAQAGGLAASTGEAFTGAGAWYELYPSSKTDIYIDPLASFGATFTVDEIQSITYHTLNNATNPSDVDFYLTLYTDPTSCVVPDDSWYCHRLTGEPLYNEDFVAPTAGVWNTYTTDDTTNQLTFNDSNHSGSLGFYLQPTLQEIQAGAITWSTLITSGDSTPIDYGPEAIEYISFQTGSGWSAFEGYLDSITIELTSGATYEIDLEDATSPVYVDDNWTGSLLGAEVDTGKFYGWNAFDTVQGGVDNVTAGGTVYVAAGTYAENVSIEKQITLAGEDAATTVIDGGGSGIVVMVQADGVEISGFTVQNSGATEADAGIGVFAADNANLHDNLIQNNAIGVGLGGATGVVVDENTFKNNYIGVGISHSPIDGAPSTGNTISDNTITDSIHSGIYGDQDCDDNDILDNTISSVVGAADGIYLWKSSGNTLTGNVLSNNTQYGLQLMGSNENTITGNTLTGNLDGIRIRISGWPEGAYPATPNTIQGNAIYGNTAYNLYAAPELASVDASLNYWGSACEPTGVTGNVVYSPWWTDPAGLGTATSSGGEYVFPAGATTAEMNAMIVCAVNGSTLAFESGSYPGGLMVGADKSDLTFLLNGVTVGAASPAFTIDGEDITIQGPGILDGGGSTDAGLLVNAGGDNLILNGVELTGWRDGLELAGSVTSFKVVNNWFHNNSESGLQINSGVVLDGVVTIEGNLFKENTGTGIQNDSGLGLEAEYNSWGHIDGPDSGDTVSEDVDADPWNYFEIYMDVEPDTGALVREVVEGETVDVALKMDTEKLYGMSFKVSFDPGYITLNSVTLNPYWADKCTNLSTAGVVAYHCHLELYEAERDVVGETILTMNVTAGGGGLPSTGSPWDAPFDISHLEAENSAGAVAGVKIWVNNAGYGLPSLPERDLTDADDGKLVITGIANYRGFVDLEGRANDSGAHVQVYSVADKMTSILLADAYSASSGAYYTAHLAPNVLLLGNTYSLFIDRDLFLPTTVMAVDANLNPIPPIPTVWYHSKLLSVAPYTPLNMVLLLGGDANNDDVIDILDAGCIGGDYSLTPGVCGTGGTSDVNGDGVVDMLDLSLMGTNYTKNYSPWNP
jgi:parallel beta-helix repeat protein